MKELLIAAIVVALAIGFIMWFAGITPAALIALL